MSMQFRFENVSRWKWIDDENGIKKKLTILDHISFDSCGDKIHAIVGPSGSGKTTLLRLLNKLESPDQGNILLDGKNIADLPARRLRKDVGMVFQVPALFRGAVEQNIRFGPELNKRSLPPQEIIKLLKTVGLENIEPSRAVENLSIGQQQRVSFARALANEPKVLLLDEPTSALDPSAANNLLDLVRLINRELGIGIVIVTHVMSHAQRIADFICLLADGRIIEHGAAKEFFDQPKTAIGFKFIRGEL